MSEGERNPHLRWVTYVLWGIVGLAIIIIGGRAFIIAAVDRATGRSAPLTQTSAPSDVRINLLADRTTVPLGVQTVRVRVTDSAGTPLSRARVAFRYGMESMLGMGGPSTVDADPEGPGTYMAKLNFQHPGAWQLTVVVERSGQPEARASFAVLAGGPGDR
jgi:hypothetical protein